MAKPRTPPHGGTPDQPPQSGGGGGGDPPKRRTTTGGAADEPDNVAAAQARVAHLAQGGRPGESRRLTPSGSMSALGPAAKIPLLPPNPRHNLNSIRPDNSVVLSGTDVAANLAEISAGRG
ncbi:hypothetical protein [Paractinoplanes toevensis]|uniref:Uncharacterized protein n=1 Tax=Paractinoplanes toevensis TaxID=571911 RepID=A0A919W9I4_9ACTN|nr:hypothetical protein [Actinoplanes toevensis]GIM96065.1 hypothetical protein Ato02nite_078580 [Actinoplanes toevensis]